MGSRYLTLAELEQIEARSLAYRHFMIGDARLEAYADDLADQAHLAIVEVPRLVGHLRELLKYGLLSADHGACFGIAQQNVALMLGIEADRASKRQAQPGGAP